MATWVQGLPERFDSRLMDPMAEHKNRAAEFRALPLNLAVTAGALGQRSPQDVCKSGS